MLGSLTNSLEAISSHALTYELRDRRYDRTVENAIDQKAPMTNAQIEMMTGRFHANYV